jgi:serpin B
MKSKCYLLAAMAMFGVFQTILSADDDLQKLAVANNDFSFKLLRQLTAKQPDGNVFISPYSAATALQMAANGAGGKTRTEMQQVLGTANLSAEELGRAARAASALLNSISTNVILSTANALWYKKNTEIKPDFLAPNQNFFSSTIKPLDFSNAPDAEAEINHWANDQTHGRITGIADHMVSPDTDLILANAIYFKGKWKDAFDQKVTKDRPFQPAVGAKTKLPTMHRFDVFNYREGTGYQAVRLPYEGGSLAMYVFLPVRGSNPAKLLRILNAEKVEERDDAGVQRTRWLGGIAQVQTRKYV